MLDLTVIVPNIGRPTLARTLKSIPTQDGIDVLCIPDIPPSGNLGHPQRNLGMKYATSRWLAFMDDDDAYTPDAFQHIEANLNGREVPHIFQMRYGDHPHATSGDVLWRDPTLRFGNVGTPMFIVPNLPGKLGVWPSKRGGDYDFIRDTCALQGDPVWVPEVIAEVRPWAS